MKGEIGRSGRIPGLVVIVLLAAALVACSGVQPFDYTAIDEIQPGPGLFSGEAGEFVLYRR